MKIRRSSPLRRAGSERGVVLLFVLMTMVILLIGAVALIRSSTGSMTTAGNIAFKRDLLNQGERSVPLVLAAMKTGDLKTAAARADHLLAKNYSAKVLETNDAGIPKALLSDTEFKKVGDDANDIEITEQKVRVRYVVDRLCTDKGLDSVLGEAKCALANSAAPIGGSALLPSGSGLIRPEDPSAISVSGGGGAGAVKLQVVYRLSIRVDGPRGTQAFYQTTFTL